MDLKLKNNSQLSIPLVNRVEYIETSGYPYINTGITLPDYFGKNASGTFVIDAIIEILDTTTNNSVIYRGLNSQTNRPWFRLNYTIDNENNCMIYNGMTSGNHLTTKLEGKTHIIQACTSRSANTNYVEINGVKTYTPAAHSNYSNVPSFVLFESGDCKTKIWSYKIYKAGTLVRNYVPVVSTESGHVGEAALYDLVYNKYYYSASTGTFTASHSQGLHDIITSAYIKDCPNVSSIHLLRGCMNLNRVRLDIGTQLGTVAELYKYAAYAGFNDAYENQTKPRLIGTWTISDYWTDEELSYLQSAFDGLTINSDSNKNIETLLENGDMAVQTIDYDRPEYNQSIAEVLISNGIGHTVVSDNTKYFITKDEAAAIASLPVTLFRGNTDIETFDEFKYWTGLTTITAGTGTAASAVGAFGLCTNLESIELPEGLTTIGDYAFYGDTALNRIVVPSTLTTTGDYCFTNCTGMTGGDVYYNGTLEQWMNITFNSAGGGRATSPMGQGSHFYINEEELTQLTIPSGTTQIKNKTFSGFKYITGTLTIPSTVTSIGNSSFYGCTSLTAIIIQGNITTIPVYAFAYCSSITSFTIPTTVTSVGEGAFKGCTALDTLVFPSQVTSIGQYNFTETPNLNLVIQTTNDFALSLFTNSVGKSLRLYGGIKASTNVHYQIHFTDSIIIDGNYQPGLTSKYAFQTYCPKMFRVQGNLSNSYTLTNASTANAFKFIEVIGTASFRPSVAPRGLIVHLGYNNVTWSPSWAENVGNWNLVMGAVYVGSGISRAADQAILDLYNASSTWTSYIAKFGLWYDYNGEYKWYYITDNLTNCTNTNPDAWPHITRGESYETTIVSDEGMTIDSITVEMLDTDTTSSTYDTMVDITSSVYDSSTGEISIPSVTGNVVITASAS